MVSKSNRECLIESANCLNEAQRLNGLNVLNP